MDSVLFKTVLKIFASYYFYNIPSADLPENSKAYGSHRLQA